MTEQLAAEGYVVLRYSSRGFGETPGEVDLMGPKETRDLLDAVDWLNDPASPVVGGMVCRNRIGQFGGSYGGAHAWALAASGHPAVRTTIPTATWTDIYDALLPERRDAARLRQRLLRLRATARPRGLIGGELAHAAELLPEPPSLDGGGQLRPRRRGREGRHGRALGRHRLRPREDPRVHRPGPQRRPVLR